MISDGELVSRSVSGDRQAAATLIERHAAAVYAVCLGLLADPDAAQDLSQETLLRGIARMASLKNPASFRSWLVSIAHNLCRDSWQQGRRRRELLAREMDTVVAAGGADAAPVPGLGRGNLDDPDDDLDLRRALARLPEKHRLPLLLFYFDGQSTARVAEALGIRVDAAATRLCRARRALRDILEVSHD